MPQAEYSIISIIVNSIINLFYVVLIIQFIYYCYSSIKLTDLIAPSCTFLGLEILIFLLNRRIPKRQDFLNILVLHLLLFFDSAFITMDILAYFQFQNHLIFFRITIILIEYMMIHNIVRIVEQGYQCSHKTFWDLMIKNSEFLIYEALLLFVGSTIEFILYGGAMFWTYIIISIITFLSIVLLNFIYGSGIWKIINQNLSRL